jgi:hypothetical protein
MDEQRQSLFGQLQRVLRRFIARNTWPSAGSEQDGNDGDELVGARVRPRPHLNSGAVALHLPDDEE